jgi:hypothetical protein
LKEENHQNCPRKHRRSGRFISSFMFPEAMTLPESMSTRLSARLMISSGEWLTYKMGNLNSRHIPAINGRTSAFRELSSDARGKVWVCPLILDTNTMVAPNSPILLAKANMAPVMITGMISGKIMVKNVPNGPAPSARAASSSPRSTLSIESLTARTRTSKKARLYDRYPAGLSKAKGRPRLSSSANYHSKNSIPSSKTVWAF